MSRHPLQGTLFVLLIACIAATAVAEPNLVAYPTGEVRFRYDPSRYEPIGPSSPAFDPNYAVAGQMLWDHHKGRPAYEIHRAPDIEALEPSGTGRSEFFYVGEDTDVIIDGFFETPRQIANIHVVFRPIPTETVEVFVDNQPVADLRYVIPRLDVTTPTGSGFYSDTISFSVSCKGASRIEVVVFSDRNGNHILDGDPEYTLILDNLTIPVEETTWGGVKSLYQ